jgi:hypothetical protein
VQAGPYVQLLYRASWVGCGLGLTATCYFLAGLSGHVNNPLLNALAVAATMLAALFFLAALARALNDTNRLGRLLWVLIVAVILVQIVLSLVPPTTRDELTHHLLMPRLYVERGRIFDLPFAPYSYFPMLLDMLYTPWIRWGWDSAPKLVHGLFGFLTGLLLYAYLSHRLSPLYGLLGFFFYVSTPVVLRLSNAAYVDLGLVFYSTASLLCLVYWLEDSAKHKWLILAGLSAGFAVATKPNGLLVVLLLVLLTAFALGKNERGTLWIFSRLFLFGIFALLALSPWLVKNMVETGNPLFPFYTNLLGGTFSGEGDSSSLTIFEKRRLMYSESWLQIAALPLRIFFSGRDDQPQFFDGVLSPLLILFIPWALKGKWAKEGRLFFGFAGLYLLCAIFLSDLRIRYLLPIVPPLVLLAVYGIHNLYLRIVRPSLLAAAVVLLTVLNGMYLWGYFQTVSPLDYLSGRESRTAYLSRVLPEYQAFQYVSMNLPATARIYLLFMGRRAYYCERDYFHDLGETPAMLLRVIQGAKNGEEIESGLRKGGLTHLIVREALLQRFLENNLAAENLKAWDGFIRIHLRKLYQDSQYAVFQIHD